MAVVFPDQGKKALLHLLLSEDPGFAQVCLFSNNVTPDEDTVIEDLTMADFSGFVEASFTSGYPPAIDGSGRGFLGKTFVFTHNGGGTANTIYGWYLQIKDADSEWRLLLAEKFPAPLVLSANGHNVTFDLTILDELGA